MKSLQSIFFKTGGQFPLEMSATTHSAKLYEQGL